MNRKATVDLPKKQRSAVTNGRRVFVEGDGNSAWTRRFKDIISEHASDLGGLDVLSQAQQALIRRAATLSVQLEAMEGRLSEGLDIDMDLYGRLTGHQARVLQALGLRRALKDVTPDLRTYLAQRKKEAAS